MEISCWPVLSQTAALLRSASLFLNICLSLPTPFSLLPPCPLPFSVIMSSPPTSNPVVGNLNSERAMKDEERGGGGFGARRLKAVIVPSWRQIRTPARRGSSRQNSQLVNVSDSSDLGKEFSKAIQKFVGSREAQCFPLAGESALIARIAIFAPDPTRCLPHSAI